MRLIDADALMDYCQNQNSKTISCNDIARFPTAYDVDKVVEQLEKASCYIEDGYGHAGHLVFTDEAIDIVRRGGRVDDR